MGSYGDVDGRADWSDAELSRWEQEHTCAVCARLGEHPGAVTGSTAGDVAPACAAHVGWCGECGTLYGHGACDACIEESVRARHVERVGTPVLDEHALPCGWAYAYPCGVYVEYVAPHVVIDDEAHCSMCAHIVRARRDTLPCPPPDLSEAAQ